ncbi:MAG: hypothetical protein IJW54_00085 [Clostridia bacterium]|nr:hypothetical protein [Clostridia bacterium]
MIRIKLNLFEGIVACTIFPNIGLFVTTLFLIISLIVKQEQIVYKGILISYISCLSLLLLSIILTFIASKIKRNELVLFDNTFEFKKNRYHLKQIIFCEYYVCKWYAVPVSFIYKQQVAGLIDIKLNTGERIKFKIFYRDYQKLKNKLQNIIEK